MRRPWCTRGAAHPTILLAGALLAGAVPGCTLVSAVDVCSRTASAPIEINVRTDGAQAVSGAHPVAALPDGGAIVVFRSAIAADDDGAGPASIRIAVLDALGRPAERTCDAPGELDLVPSTPGVRFDEASIAMPDTTDEELGLVVYSSRDGAGRQIRGAFVSRTGCRRGISGDGTFLISDTAPGDADRSALPSVVWLGEQTFLVVWSHSETLPPLDMRASVRARVVRADETTLPEFLPTVADPSGASVAIASGVAVGGLAASLGADRAGIGWSELRGSALVPHYMVVDGRLEAVVADRALAAVGPADMVRSATARGRAVAFDGAQVVVAWTAADAEGHNRVHARYLDAAGASLTSPQSLDGSPFLVRDDVASEDEGRLSIAAFRGGGFVVAMEQVGGEAGRFETISARLFDGTGGAGFANPACDARSFTLVTSDGDLSEPALERLADGSILVVYTSDGASGADRSGTGVRATHFDARDLLPLP